MGVLRAGIFLGELEPSKELTLAPDDDVAVNFAVHYSMTGPDGLEYTRTAHKHVPFTPETVEALRVARDGLRMLLGDTFEPLAPFRGSEWPDRMRAAAVLLEDALRLPS